MPSIMFLTKYGPKAASTRHRFLQYFPVLEKSGFHCEYSALLSDKYLSKKFSSGRLSLIEILKCIFSRLRVLTTLKKYDLVVVYGECFPYFPYFLEYLLILRRVKYIYDFDDAFFTSYELHKNPLIRLLLRNKIRKIIQNAEMVFAGNEYLAQYALKVNRRVEIIPTVVDLDKYTLKKQLISKQPFTIGWIGSPSTIGYVKEIIPALNEFSAKHDLEIYIVGVNKVDFPGLKVQVKDWSLETEVEDIKAFDVGIMPLPDSAWAKGKCAFKIIQYMACGLPVIASAVGANNQVVQDKKTGFLVSREEEWVSSLELLYNNKELQISMGQAGRIRAENGFSLQIMAPRVSGLIKTIMEK